MRPCALHVVSPSETTLSLIGTHQTHPPSSPQGGPGSHVLLWLSGPLYQMPEPSARGPTLSGSPGAPGQKELQDCGSCPEAGWIPPEPGKPHLRQGGKGLDRAGWGWSELASARGSVALVGPGYPVPAASGDGSQVYEAPPTPSPSCHGSQAQPGVHIRPFRWPEHPRQVVREARPAMSTAAWRSPGLMPGPPLSPHPGVVAGRGSAPANWPPSPRPPLPGCAEPDALGIRMVPGRARSLPGKGG